MNPMLGDLPLRTFILSKRSGSWNIRTKLLVGETGQNRQVLSAWTIRSPAVAPSSRSP